MSELSAQQIKDYQKYEQAMNAYRVSVVNAESEHSNKFELTEVLK